jgi:hypothetical protein
MVYISSPRTAGAVILSSPPRPGPIIQFFEKIFNFVSVPDQIGDLNPLIFQVFAENSRDITRGASWSGPEIGWNSICKQEMSSE